MRSYEAKFLAAAGTGTLSGVSFLCLQGTAFHVYTLAVVEVMVSTGQVRLELQGWARLSLRTDLTFPLSSIIDVHADPNPYRPWRVAPLTWVRLGFSIPGVIQAGTFSSRSEREFWCVYYSGRSIVFELDNIEYTRVIVDVRNPEAVVQRVRAACRQRLIP